TQTGGSTLTAQQPLNNVVRVALQALAAVLGGTQSLHTNSFDEALALLTAELETQARALLALVEKRGGAARCAADGFIAEEIARSAYAAQQAIERGDDVVVGVNKFADGQDAEPVPMPDFSALATKQIAQLRAAKAKRDQPRVAA